MGTIHVLDEDTINQIAAGEVIENPASVVKELVENSLDAGAKNIWVEIRGGGFQLIRVADDGVGMSRDDSVLCFERHATSKLTQIEDLNGLFSMGFRGEALASIAAISKVDLVTAQEGKDGNEIIVEGGAIRKVQSAPRSRGTTISIRSLFYNVPARKKFQKSAAAATADIYKLLLSLVLAHPSVGFELSVADSIALSAPPESDASLLSNLDLRIEKVFDQSFLQGRRPVCYEKNGYLLSGWLGSPADDRINRTGQYLFINNRAVISPLVSSAIKAGYGHRLNERRYPIFVLHLTVPPSEIDVNVHPQKREVRFQNEEWVRQFLAEAVQTAFQEKAVSPGVFDKTEWAPPLTEMPLCLREESVPDQGVWAHEPVVIGLFGHFLLLQDDDPDGIVWVHLKRAHELVLLRSMDKKESGSRSQGLLIPIPLPLNKSQQVQLEEKRAILQQIGFSIEMSGKDTFLIHAIPPFVEAGDAPEAVQLVLDGHEVIKRLAAFAARGKTRFVLQEALALWHQVKESPDPAVVAKTGPDVIERLFK